MCDALFQSRGRLKAVVCVHTLKLIQSKEYQPLPVLLTQYAYSERRIQN